MGNNLTTYRRSGGGGGGANGTTPHDPTARLKAQIRPQTGLLSPDPDLLDENDSGFATNSLHFPPAAASQPPDSTNFVRNRKDLVSMRSSKYSPKNISPMPGSDELEKRFTKVLVSENPSFLSYLVVVSYWGTV
jgi:hypothetical protein